MDTKLPNGKERIIMEQVTWLTRKQTALQSGIFPANFNYLIQQETFSSFLKEDKEFTWLVNKEVIPIIKDYYTTHMNAFNYYEAHSDFLISYRVAPMLNKTNQQLLTEIHEGKWNEMIVKVPRLRSPEKPYLDEKYHYFFIKEKLLQGRYNTIEQIASQTTLISRERLQKYRKMGLLPQPAHLTGTNLFDENEILTLLPSLKLEFRQRVSENGKDQVRSAFDLLSPTQQQVIKEYLQYRDRGGKINYNGYRSQSSIANKSETLENLKSKISAALVVIISGRCGIEEDFHKNPFFRNETPKAYNPEVFDIYSISKEDFAFLAAKRKPQTLIQIYHHFRPFYYYLLEKLEEDAIESDDLKDLRDFKRIDGRIKKFLNQFPTTSRDINLSDYDKKSKTFLTREQMVLIKKYILEDVITRDPVKNATMWQFSCTCGIRPQELPKIEIGHFKLNSEGFLDQDENGWGLVMLPAAITKQDNSPSHPEYHTPIPTSTVNQLNLYLSRLYRLQGEKNPRGSGYLFRPEYALPSEPYKAGIQFDFINRVRIRLDFIDDVQKKDFIFKASRHSLNNTIMRTYIKKDAGLNEAKRTASDHQLRHKPSKTVGEEYYLEDITKEQYYAVLDLTINFPWDLEKLVEWEIAKGYRIPVIPIQQEQKEESEEMKKLQQQLQTLEEQLQALREKPKHFTEHQWINERQLLLSQQKLLQTRLHGVD
jgi:integrase